MSFDGCYPRLVRHGGSIQRLWVRRGVCPHCAASHALLPEFLLAHRLDTLDAISDALAGRPEPYVARSTLAGWRRRLGTNRPAIVAGTGSAVVTLGGSLPWTLPLGSLRSLLVALWSAARLRVARVPRPWRLLNVITASSWLGIRVASSWVGVSVVPVPVRGP
jgi:hypothetical protein